MINSFSPHIGAINFLIFDKYIARMFYSLAACTFSLWERMRFIIMWRTSGEISVSWDFHISPFGGKKTSPGCILEMFSICSSTCQAKSTFSFPGEISEICKDRGLFFFFQLVSPFVESDVLLLHSKFTCTKLVTHTGCNFLLAESSWV